MPNTPSLTDQMRLRADADRLPETHPMRLLATAFDEATQGFDAKPKTTDFRTFLSAWARARRAWCYYTGEPLV